MDKKERLKKPYNSKVIEEHISFNYTNDFSSNKDPYCIIMPPPNVTGALHMGHALVNTLQDILTRYHRMKGFEALWIPGTDHAGIATQSVVEKKLFKETGKRRCDFTREEFLGHIEKWNKLHQGKIQSQIKRLGCNPCWEKEKFTLDEDSTKAVLTAFKQMYDDGLIYRGDYLVNWDTHLGTAIADDEVEHEEKDSFLWYFSYPVETGETITIATTRPETMLGDTAVAVNPSDEKYAHLIGKNVLLPITNRKIPIIADHYVDKEFGTGAVKITPAHDFNDYEIGIRHDLPMINIMHSDGTINENGGDFKNMTAADARANVVERMIDLGFLVKIEPHKNRVGVSYRSKTVIEPLLSKQWFVRMGPFKEKLLSAVFDSRVEIIPKEWEKTYRHWIENLKDWCISRQLWWGHRIPIWYDKESDETFCYVGDDIPQQVKDNPGRYYQDEDVLDTWFSSGLWPLTCLGYPHINEDMAKFYPTAVLVTGHDLLFFWIARMILMGEYAGHDVPFKQVFMHGLIFGKSYWRKSKDGDILYLDRKEWMKYEKGEKIPKDVEFKWEKMSKSKGNVIDPIEVIEDYGTCALRVALTSLTSTAKQIDLDFRKFEESKNFINKLWNASSFVINSALDNIEGSIDEKKFCLEDKWILSRYSSMIEKTEKCIESYDFQELFQTLYNFFWNDFCSYYLEMCKPYLYDKVGSKEEKSNKQWILFSLLTGIHKCLHPIAPYVTEEIFSILQEMSKSLEFGNHDLEKELKKSFTSPTITESSYPEHIKTDTSSVDTFEKIKASIYAIRNICSETNIPPSEKIEIAVNEDDNLIKDYSHLLGAFIKISHIDFQTKVDSIDSPIALAKLDDRKIAVKIPQALVEKEKKRMEKNLEKTLVNLQRVQDQLANEKFTQRAPKELIEEKKALLDSLLEAKKELEAKLSN